MSESPNLDDIAAAGERPVQTISPEEAALRARLAADKAADKWGGDEGQKQAEEEANRPKPGTDKWAEGIIEGHKQDRFDPDNPPPDVDPILTLAEVPVLTPGNLAVLCGPSGTAKSHTSSAILAALMAPEPEQVDCLGWEARNPAGKAVIYLDFEQSAKDFHTLMKTACRRAGTHKPPPWLYAYHLTGMYPEQAKDFVQAALMYSKSKHGGTHVAIVDGIADLCETVNNEVESIAFVRGLHAMAIRYETGIFGILHLNPGSDFKTRGHLGSQAERKAETVLTLKRDQADAISAATHKSRHAPIPEGKGPRFQWDAEWGGFRSTETKAEERRSAADEKNAQLARDLFAVKPSLSHKDATDRLAELTGAGFDAAKKRLGRLRNAGFVSVTSGTGYYSLGPAAKEEKSNV